MSDLGWDSFEELAGYRYRRMEHRILPPDLRISFATKFCDKPPAMNPAIKGRVTDLGGDSALQVRGEFWPVLTVFSAGIGFAVLVRKPLRMRAQAARASRGPVGDFEVHSVAAVCGG